jgi:hypothetical protein
MEDQYTCYDCITCTIKDTMNPSERERQYKYFTSQVTIVKISNIIFIFTLFILGAGLPVVIIGYSGNQMTIGIILVCLIASITFTIFILCMCIFGGIWLQRYRLFAPPCRKYVCSAEEKMSHIHILL